MKILKMMMVGCLVLNAAAVSFAQKSSIDGPYEHQVQLYPSINDGLLGEKQEKLKEQKKKNTELKITEMQLEAEHEGLQINIEEKEVSVQKLKDVNERLLQVQVVLNTQYSELKELFDQQKAENQRLKQELESSKGAFNYQMLEFYEKEEKLAAEKIETLTVRRDEVRAKLEELKENIARGGSLEKVAINEE